jgi:predicted aldo/keto reductase-like oxidoreductase
MRTEYLDLWQVHDVRNKDDIQEIFGTGGAIHAFIEAKQKGLVRFIGVTGHHEPKILKKCLEMFDFDTILFPVNPAEPSYNSFFDLLFTYARQKNLGIIGMKVYFRGLAEKLSWAQTIEPFLHYALSQPVTTVVIGCDNPLQLEQNVKYAVNFKPMSDRDMKNLVQKTAPYARQLMYYKP